MLINTFIFIIVLSMLVLSHELGHFIVAKACGVGVEKFSLGFGPRIIGFRLGITDYYLSAIPLGGYVKMVGDGEDPVDDETLLPFSFSNKSVLKRIFIVLAGPVFNLLFAILIFFVIFCFSGIVILKPKVGDVIKHMPANKSGIEAGDNIISIDGVLIESWDGVVSLVSQTLETNVNVLYNRFGIYSKVIISPSLVNSKNLFGQKINKCVIGITPSGEIASKQISLVESFNKSFIKTYELTSLTVLSIAKLLQGSISAKSMGGPIMIAEMVGNNARVGIINLLFFVGLLSVNLAVLNCLPIPILDGGHLLFFLYEAISGKPLNSKLRERAHQIGALFLFFIMIYVFYNDLLRVFYK